jgi:peptidoglycan/xylan/chitin deacetylase (PgdA/CDA1 family)
LGKQSLMTSLLTKPDMRALIVTHDIDWPIHGPGKTHVLARNYRFTTEIIQKVERENFNPYFGIPKVIEIEEKYGVRSTFFFRPRYDDGSEVEAYKETMRILLSGRWEVGLHSNITSTPQEVASEKQMVEKASGQPVYGSRVHYLRVAENTFANLAEAGIKYDSSLCFNKEQIDFRNTGFVFKDGLVVFPVTFMDAYLFSYMHLTEETIVPFIAKSIENLFDSGARILTLLWHDNSVMMRGGRAYEQLIKRLVAKEDTTFLKGIEAYQLINKEKGS